MRERNREDQAEIDKLNQQNEQKGKEAVDHGARIRTLEYDISKSLNKVDELNRLIDQKSMDLKQKEAQLADAEADVAKLRNQQASFKQELENLRAVEERYRGENADLARRNDEEGARNAQL